jgi:hypothetical protein
MGLSLAATRPVQGSKGLTTGFARRLQALMSMDIDVKKLKVRPSHKPAQGPWAKTLDVVHAFCPFCRWISFVRS